MRPPVRPPEINVTPLVDVVLVLLIIFMVVVPQMEAGAAVTPPLARNPDPTGSVDGATTIMLDAGGALYLDKRPVRAEELRAELGALRKHDPHRPLRIKADREVPYREVRTVYRLTQDAGFPGVGLEVGEPDDAEREER